MFVFIQACMTYHWKVIKKDYNFVIEITSIIIHVKKLQLHKHSNTFVSHET
jgi:hypothetical protein